MSQDWEKVQRFLGEIGEDEKLRPGVAAVTWTLERMVENNCSGFDIVESVRHLTHVRTVRKQVEHCVAETESPEQLRAEEDVTLRVYRRGLERFEELAGRAPTPEELLGIIRDVAATADHYTTAILKL